MSCLPKLVAFAIPGIPLIQAGDDIIDIIIAKRKPPLWSCGPAIPW